MRKNLRVCERSVEVTIVRQEFNRFHGLVEMHQDLFCYTQLRVNSNIYWVRSIRDKANVYRTYRGFVLTK
jgi:hypothetical protein